MSTGKYGDELGGQAEGEVIRPPRRSVGALSKMFGGQDDTVSSRSIPPSRSTTSSYVKNTYSSQNSDPSSSTRTTSVSRDGSTTETTTTTTTQTFSERVKSSSQGSQYTSYSPSRSTKVTETTYTSDKDVGDQLYDSLIPSSITDGSPVDSQTTVSSTETVIVKSSPDTTYAEDKLFDTLVSPSPKSDYSPTESRNGFKTTTTTRTSSSTAEDDLYGTLLPKTITSVSSLPSPVSSSSSITQREIITVESSRGGDSPTLSSPTSSTRRTSSSYSPYTDTAITRTTSYSSSSAPSDDYSSKNYSYRTDSYSSLNSPTSSYSSKSYRSNSRSDDMADQTYSSSVKSVYAAPERVVLEKDLCTICRKPFIGDAKMVLDDMKINCHASCFKCEVCNSTLGNMRAGDSMWIYKRMVHCENCFEVTRDKWRR
ncbi:sciellin isoform X2 [Sebastes umbrosus]|uniref:sciellin isoform X2 n=1 Tax=Sebastes umbrosus TaxID=72105 RepID=UPI00189FEC74|nr:sciellin isoform X2 [Sebastes umbrosus]